MPICNCHNCRFVLPEAVTLLQEVSDEGNGDYENYIERVDKFLREVEKYEIDTSRS